KAPHRNAADPGRYPGLAEDSAPSWLGRRHVAEALRRAGLERGSTAHLRRRVCASQRPSADSFRGENGSTGVDGVWERRAAGIFPAANSLGRALVVSGVFRAGLGIGPGLTTDPRGARR